jgi:hypothetical protein
MVMDEPELRALTVWLAIILVMVIVVIVIAAS